jgi:hypothetical protein
MKQRRKRRCRHCGELFQPDRRNLRHQRYCAQPACRKESHAASQRRWLKKPENRDYFRGPAHGQRVRAWRAAHPGYWRRTGTQRAVALQEDSHVQPVEIQRDSGILVPAMLQDVIAAQPLVLIGLIANLTGSALQEDIAESSRRLLRLGQDIIGGTLPPSGGDDAQQTVGMPRAGPQGP